MIKILSNIFGFTRCLLLVGVMTGFLSACSSDDALPSGGEKGGTPIAFAVSYEENSSATGDKLNGAGAVRAVKVDLDVLKTNGFSVYANAANGESEVKEKFMNAQAVAWNTTTNLWEYSPVKLWPTNKNATVDFYAAYTDGSENVKTLYDWYNKPQTSFYVNEVVSKQTDMLWAAPKLNVNAQAESNVPVTFNFKHALAGFFFTIKLDDNYQQPAGTTITVNSLYLSGYFAPKAQILPDEITVDKAFKLEGNWNERTYSISTDYTDELNAAVTAGEGVTSTEKNLTGNKGYIMVIPFAQEYTVTLNYTVTDVNGPKSYSVGKKVENVTDLVAGNMLKTLLILTPGGGNSPGPVPPPVGGGNLNLKVTLVDWTDVKADQMEVIQFE